MRVPIASILQGEESEWPLYYDSPEERLLVRLYNEDRIEIEMEYLGIEGEDFVFSVHCIKQPKMRLVGSGS
jgi:hypothetical protein